MEGESRLDGEASYGSASELFDVGASATQVVVRYSRAATAGASKIVGPVDAGDKGGSNATDDAAGASANGKTCGRALPSDVLSRAEAMMEAEEARRGRTMIGRRMSGLCARGGEEGEGLEKKLRHTGE